MSVPKGTLVRVYRNLNNGLYSVMHKGLVVGHASHLGLADVVPVVLPAGQARVRRERRKHVHAFLQGTLTYWDTRPGDPMEEEYGVYVTYNPYLHDTFVVYGPTPLVCARAARFTPYGVSVMGGTFDAPTRA